MDNLQLGDTKLITNNRETNFFDELQTSLKTCNAFFFSVAFINYSGLQLLLDSFKDLDNRNCKGKVITSTYLNFTDIKSLRKLQTFRNIDTKIYIADQHIGFHTKGYVFEYDEFYKIIVGSSNITQSALKSNVEWNVRYISKNKSDTFVQEIITEFDNLWDITSNINDSFLREYENFLNELSSFVKEEKRIFEHKTEITPNKMQLRALQNLKDLRESNQNRALIIAATGTGKTYLSAFDVKQMTAKRVLFVVHRRVILESAMASYSSVFGELDMYLYQGKNKQTDANYIFAMIQTLSINENYTEFNKDYFDYIIIDEAHRSFSDSYQRILNYFTPDFLLGMTATPERTDGGNIFNLFNNNIGLEVRLRDALEEDLVIPFHYFGITDVESEFINIDKKNISDIAALLSVQNRVDLILEKMEHYGFSGSKRKCLGFCISKAHALYMASEFNQLGYTSIALTSENSDEERESAIIKLEDNHDSLEFIFTVDIFNEGVDIPSVNLVLMLRPTQSPIIFTQQLGRGLRKHDTKDFLTILDFIGNHNKAFLLSIALSGSKYYDRDSLKVQVAKNFRDIPGCTNIALDEIVKERILRQLESVNFNSKAYLKQEYNEFKKILGGKTPELIDYILHESSPDPVKFILKESSYESFVDKMESRTKPLNDREQKILETIDKMLPIKRINEFVILKLLFEQGVVRYDDAVSETLKLVSKVPKESISHSFDYFAGLFLGPNEQDPFDYIKVNDQNELYVSEPITDTLRSKILLTINYGILRYQEDFGKEITTYPYLKKYAKYKMKDMGFLSNYRKSFSSIRGSGVWRNGNHFYLFVDLHKGEDIPDNIDYKDKLLSRTTMQWETQNKTSQDSETGKDLCQNVKRNIILHMFVRKAKQIGSQKLDYTYLGKVNSITYEGNKPITIQMEFVSKIPQLVFDDLTLVV